MIKKRANDIMVFISILLAAYGCSGPGNQAGETSVQADSGITVSKSQFSAADMKIDTMTATWLSDQITATGIIDVPEGKKALLGSYFSGRVGLIRVVTGQRVAQGELLFTVNNPEFIDLQREYLETTARYHNLKAAFGRMQALSDDQTASKRELMQAESEYHAAEATRNALAEKLKLLHIDPDRLTAENLSASVAVKAPFAGTVSRLMIQAGQWINPEDQAVELLANNQMVAKLDVFEQVFPWLRTGQAVNLSLTGNPGQTLSGTISQLGTQVDPQKRTILITVAIDEKHRAEVLPGMYVNANIEAGKSRALCLPENALVEQNGAFFALIARKTNNGGLILKKAEVKPGKTIGGWTEILNAGEFVPGSLFLTQGVFQLVHEAE